MFYFKYIINNEICNNSKKHTKYINITVIWAGHLGQFLMILSIYNYIQLKAY